MKHYYLSFFLFLIVIQAFTQKEINKLDSLMSSIYAKDRPGAAIAVVIKGEVIFKKGYGIADLSSNRPITPSTNFNICSMTKQFTAYSILKLADERKLSLDDKMDKYFPDFNSEVARRITIRHLLTHSSGIIDHYGYVNKSQFKEFWDKDALNAVKSVDSVYFPAGSGYRYSNTAYCLLSLIIEHVSGYSFPVYIRENIFEPLKMYKSDVINPGFKIPERAFGYEFDNGKFNISDAGESLFFTTMGDGGIYTSVNEYLKWIMAIQEGKVLNSGLIEEAQSPHSSIDKTRNLSYGYGWFVVGSGDNKIVFHTGSNGGFRTIIFTIPSKKYSVVIFSNRTGIDLEDLVHEINRIFKIDDKTYVKLESLIS
jgi:D-alanyl-D-alanine carboxypeptidase